ncbi:hypothetical protein [Pseudodesulfovibrio pelocollis]|uniref:hypothetical protein n=1 Tax=Pseudodesulfovibrio pelocollis TaxID=3051432 RepID=UPI00255B0489|nr:hypothetical protein [Pseudodesulfovibrio sp. SB368]
MPTCEHKPCAVLPKFKGDSGTPKLSFYPAELWDEKHGGRPGTWRVMVGDKWLTRDDESVSFFTVEGIASIVLDHLAAGLGVAVLGPGLTPDLCPKSPVRYWPHGQILPTDTFTRTAPFRDQRGEWRVWVAFVQKPVLLAELSPRQSPRNSGSFLHG